MSPLIVCVEPPRAFKRGLRQTFDRMHMSVGPQSDCRQRNKSMRSYFVSRIKFLYTASRVTMSLYKDIWQFILREYYTWDLLHLSFVQLVYWIRHGSCRMASESWFRKSYTAMEIFVSHIMCNSNLLRDWGIEKKVYLLSLGRDLKLFVFVLSVWKQSEIISRNNNGRLASLTRSTHNIDISRVIWWGLAVTIHSRIMTGDIWWEA